MLNRIILMGRLTRDPELRRTGSGTAVTSFSLAVDRDFKSQSGEKETDFIDIVAWRNTAEFVSKYFTKAAWPWWRAACRSGTGPTRTAASAAVPRSWPTMCISGIPSATAATIPATTPVMRPPRFHSAAPSNFSASGSDFAEIGEDDGELPF